MTLTFVKRTFPDLLGRFLIKDWLNHVTHDVYTLKRKRKSARVIHISRMTCRNICEMYRTRKDTRSNYYVHGYKRCQICGIFIDWSGTKCPCCQRPLRSKPHNKKEAETNERRRINYINHDINSHLKRSSTSMTKKRARQQNGRSSVSYMTIIKKRIITYGIIAAVISGISIAGYKSMIPTNGNSPVFGIPSNHFVKAKYSAGSGYAWISMSSGTAKGLRGSGGGGIMNPTYVFNRGVCNLCIW